MAIKSTSPLAGLFRKSPFSPIQDHMHKVFSCICTIPPLYDALYKGDSNQIKELAEKIIAIETEADKIKSTFRLNMPRTLLLPVDREDLLNLIADQDSMADTVEEIAKILLYRDMIIPEELKPVLDELLEGTIEISSDAKTMIDELDELLEVGFGGGRELDRVNDMIAGVRKSEHNIDQILLRAKQTLFSIEDQLEPVSTMFLYKLIDLTGRISDKAENIADRLLLFLSK